MPYQADLDDINFQLFDWLRLEELLDADRFADWDRESVEMTLDEAATFAAEELAPINEAGDRAGIRYEDGRVSLPPPFVEAYKQLAEMGWIGATCSPDYGGLGLPDMIGTAVNEIFAGANMTFVLPTVLGHGVGRLIEGFGTEEQKERYCEKLYSGTWGGTMALTEAQAGSDLGAVATVATRRDDGHGEKYLLRGQKVFITAGEHDMTENIVHAVLARTPDAPPGTKGLSLFLAPKKRLSDGAMNDIRCVGVEHKMGIHASPTCSISYGDDNACEAEILGAEGDGMRIMFQMMNGARIEVGTHSVGIAFAAWQAAADYARERVQMRRWNETDRAAGPVKIIEHPDVRRMLLAGSSYVQAARALLLKTASYVDRVHTSNDEDERKRYESLVELLTPVCKAWPSDWGFRVTEWSLQVFGGYGYTADYPAEQYLRDAKITSLYEGTNGIQALDLVGRKLRLHQEAFAQLLADAAETARQLADDDVLGASSKLLASAGAELGSVVMEAARRPDLLVLNAVPLLDMVGTLLGGHFLLEQAAIARQRLVETKAGSAAAAFLHDKVQSAIFFAHRALPTIAAQAVAVKAGETAAIDAFL